MIAPYREAVAQAAEAIVPRLMADYGEARNAAATAHVAIVAYMKAAKQFDAKTRPYSPETRAMAAMKVGDVIQLTKSCHKRREAARLLMGNPDASWLISGDGAGWRCERLKDGEVGGTQITSPIVKTLAGLEVGESAQLGPQVQNFRLSSHYKAMARRLGAIPDADWSQRTTIKGVRVTRVA